MGPEQTRRTYRGERLHGVTDVQHGARAGACTRRGAAVWRGEAWVWVAGGRGLQCWPRGGVQPAGETPWLAGREPRMLRDMWAICWHFPSPSVLSTRCS